MKAYEYETYHLVAYVGDGGGGIRKMTAAEIREMNDRFEPLILRSLREFSVIVLPEQPEAVPAGSGR
jgi:hypothetical protein